MWCVVNFSVGKSQPDRELRESEDGRHRDNVLLKYICCLLLLELLLLSDYDVAFDVVADFDIDRAAEDLS